MMGGATWWTSHLLLLVVLIHITDGTIVTQKFRKLPPGEQIQGVSSRKLTADSAIKCSTSCSSDKNCTWYQYQSKKPGNCLNIEKSTTSGSAQNFTATQTNKIFKKNNCQHHECKNQAVCVDALDSYTCQCKPGFLGPLCGDGDDCPSAPCQNNGTCVDGLNSYTCSCTTNFGGVHCEIDCSGTWCSPPGWTGPSPAVYRPLDNMDQIVGGNPTFVPGKRGMAVRTEDANGSPMYAGLGDLSAACMTRPSTCGPSGGAVAFWVRMEVNDYGFLTSQQLVSSWTEGFYLENNGALTMIETGLGRSLRIQSKPQFPIGVWTHYILNYISNTANPGMSSYTNGTLYTLENYRSDRGSVPNNGDVTIGCLMTNKVTMRVSTLEMDELLFFNQTLTQTEAQALYDQLS